MHLGPMFSCGFNNNLNIKHILINNNSHESVGGQITGANKINFNTLSKSLGYKSYFRISKKKEIKSTLKKFLKSKKSSLLEVIARTNITENLPRPKDLIEIKKNFIS